MKIKTAELSGLALDWSLAGALKKRVRYCSIYKAIVFDDCEDNVYLFAHTDPATCMGLMNEYKMDVTWGVSGKCYMQPSGNIDFSWWVGGATLAEAVARCVVAMRLGDEVDVPDELCGVQS